MVLKKFVALAFIANIFSSCSNSPEENKTNSERDGIGQTTIEDEKVIKIISEVDGLSIDENCIGCGRCAFVAPDNFKMNPLTFKADVISGENIDGAEVQEAIAICPTSSIS